MKKKKNQFFVEKYVAQIRGFAVVKKAPSTWKKNFLKKILLAYLRRYDLQNGVRNIFLKINGSRDILVPVILRFRKIVLHNKFINKTRSTKNQENSAHRFVKNYLTNHLAKFSQNMIKPWRVGALRVCTGYHFFQRKSLVRVF